MKTIKVKQLSGELAKYSGWGGFILDMHKSSGYCRYLVKIAAPPKFDGKTEDIWLDSSMLIEVNAS